MTSTPTILIVEDEELVREMLCEYFEHQGLSVLPAENGHAALRLLAQHEVDIVVSDLVMPQTDGLELLMQVRREHPAVPLVAITAPNNHLYLDVASRLGAAHTFEKPLDLEALGDAVDNLVAERRRT